MSSIKRKLAATTPAEWIEHAMKVLNVARTARDTKELVKPLHFLDLPEGDAVAEFLCADDLAAADVRRFNALIIERQCEIDSISRSLYGKFKEEKFESTPLYELCVDRAKAWSFLVQHCKHGGWGCTEYLCELLPILVAVLGARGIAMLVLWERTLVSRACRSDIPETAVARAFFEFMLGHQDSREVMNALYHFSVSFTCPKDGSRLFDEFYIDFVKCDMFENPRGLDDVKFDALSDAVHKRASA